MSEAKRVPGSWYWTYDEPFCPDIVDSEGVRVSGLRCWDDDACFDGNHQRHANQKLAAAAPDMLAELKRLEQDHYCPSCHRDLLWRHARDCTLAAAIKKAEGR